MVCGIIGCGRYKNADAFKHYCTSKHILSLDLKTNHIWNYKLDCFSHRIVGRDGIMEENSRDIKFDMDFDDDRVEI
jgi:BRCA1-associated protein